MRRVCAPHTAQHDGLKNDTVRGRVAVVLQNNDAVPLTFLVSRMGIFPSADMEQQDRTAADFTTTEF